MTVGYHGVWADQVAAFYVGVPTTDAEAQALEDRAAVHLPIVTTMVEAYTRGRGFDEGGWPNDALRQVIISATARLAGNPELLTERSTALDDASITKRTASAFTGWTLPELAVLNRYRKKAM